MIHLKIMFYGLLVCIVIAIAAGAMYVCGHIIAKTTGVTDDSVVKFILGILFTTLIATVYFLGSLAYYG